MAAIYLWGYSVEMRVKAAYFGAAGFGPLTPITSHDRKDHAGYATVLFGLVGKAGGHDIATWAQMAVAARATTTRPYAQAFGQELVNNAVDIYAVWRETLRYADVLPTSGEVRTVRRIASWFHRHYHSMF